jgi:aminodeoxyfutalosine deaminase
MPIYQAAHTWTPEGWNPSLWVHVDDSGTILAIGEGVPPVPHTRLAGALVPGFVNVHCHLELSHLRNKLTWGGGMAAFARQVIFGREAPEAEMVVTVQQALDELWQTGTVAVGDIANTALLADIRLDKRGLHIQTFVEVLGRDPAQGGERFTQGVETARKFSNPASVVPHAPYSVSEALFERIYAPEHTGPSSLHLLESEEEEALFESQTGPMAELLSELGLPLPEAGTTPDAYALKHYKGLQRLLLVHCTQRLPKASLIGPNSWFGLCPRSNVNLHGKLPHLPSFLPYADRVCLGTDSLASVQDLNLFEEIKCLNNAYPEVSLHQLFGFAAWNGARFLGLEDSVGSFVVGKRPGLIHIPDMNLNTLPASTLALRIA